MFDADLDSLLARYDAPTAKLARKLVGTVFALRPEFSGKVVLYGG